MKKQNKAKKVVFSILGAIVLMIIVGAIAFKIYSNNYYKADTGTISDIADEADDVGYYYDDDMSVFVPLEEGAKAVIVFYPGGKVEFNAYSGLMYELAEKGYLCLLPRMPENIAFLRVNAVDLIKERYPDRVQQYENLDWYLAGHSLGGVAACQYLGEHLDEDEYKGIILCASYTTVDFSDTDLRLLSIYGSEDKVLKMDAYEESKSFWPKEATEYIIEGGIHSYFGNYGIQDGDGEPKITVYEQLEEATEVIDEWCIG